MADDPCECVFNHESAMRRLLSLVRPAFSLSSPPCQSSLDIPLVLLLQLRNSQGYCTDSECVQDFPGPQGAGLLTDGTGWMMIAMVSGHSLPLIEQIRIEMR